MQAVYAMVTCRGFRVCECARLVAADIAGMLVVMSCSAGGERFSAVPVSICYCGVRLDI